MTRYRVWVREGLLWTGAVLGGLSLVVAVLAATGAVRPLVFTSGSMGPVIPAGSLAFSRPVEATNLAVGDVVNVTRQDGQQVTHRIVGIELDGEQATLTLKGDANPVVDAETYTVGEAHRVIVQVPWLGSFVAAIENPLCGVALMGLLGWLILSPLRLQRRRHSAGRRVLDARRRRRKHIRQGSVVLVVVMLASAGLAQVVTPTLAGFTDEATVTSGALSAGSLQPPTSLTCTGAGLLRRPTIAWSAPTTGVAPQRYRVTVRAGSASASPTEYFVSGDSWQIPSSFLALLTTYYITVQSAVGENWTSKNYASPGQRVTVTSVVVDALTTCSGTYTPTQPAW